MITVSHRVLGTLSHHEQASLQRLVLQALAADEQLTDDRLGLPGDMAEAGVVAGHVSPAEGSEAPFADRFQKRLLKAASPPCIPGQEDHRRAVLPAIWHLDAQPAGLGEEELVRDLDEDAGPVARDPVGCGGTPVHQIQQNLLALLHDRVLAAPGDVHYRADAAGVVFLARVVQRWCFQHAGCHGL